MGVTPLYRTSSVGQAVPDTKRARCQAQPDLRAAAAPKTRLENGLPDRPYWRRAAVARRPIGTRWSGGRRRQRNFRRRWTGEDEQSVGWASPTNLTPPCQSGLGLARLAGNHGKAGGRCPSSEQIPMPHRRSGPAWGTIPSCRAKLGQDSIVPGTLETCPTHKAGRRLQAVRTGERSEASGLPNQPGHISPEGGQAQRAYWATHGEGMRRAGASGFTQVSSYKQLRTKRDLSS